MQKPATIEDIRKGFEGFPFPKFVFNKTEAALMLFCAGFYGGHDCIWVHEAGKHNVVCVDIDQEKIEIMEDLYPDYWMFICADVFNLELGPDVKFDLIVADPPLNLIDRSIEFMPKWCGFSNRYLVLTIRRDSLYGVPAGWRELGKLHRNETASWLLLVRE